MARDSIVEETRRVREELAKAQDYDLGRIVRVFKREEASGGAQAREPPFTAPNDDGREAEGGIAARSQRRLPAQRQQHLTSRNGSRARPGRRCRASVSEDFATAVARRFILVTHQGPTAGLAVSV